MKERIVIEGNMPKNLYINADDIKATREQIPETWIELLELCAKYEELDTVDFILIKGVWFNKDGEVKIGEEVITEKMSAANMWQIIKSLIGE